MNTKEMIQAKVDRIAQEITVIETHGFQCKTVRIWIKTMNLRLVNGPDDFDAQNAPELTTLQLWNLVEPEEGKSYDA